MGFFDGLSGVLSGVGDGLDAFTGFATQLGGAIGALDGLTGGGAGQVYLPPAQPIVLSPPTSSAPPPQGALASNLFGYNAWNLGNIIGETFGEWWTGEDIVVPSPVDYAAGVAEDYVGDLGAPTVAKVAALVALGVFAVWVLR